MGPSFSEWVTRPRQILIIFAITLAVAAISTSNKIHRCHASKQAKYGTHKVKMRSHSVEAADGLQLNEDAVRLMAKEARAATTASGIHAALTGKEATIVNQISDQLVESVVEEDLEAEMAEELGIRGEAEGPEETSSRATEPAGGGAGDSKGWGRGRPFGEELEALQALQAPFLGPVQGRQLLPSHTPGQRRVL